MQENILQNQRTQADESRSHHLESLLAAAREYLARGWPVIPLSGKLPTVSWKEYQSRVPDNEELRSWFTDNHSPTGLGIVTGKLAGLVVVDCDSRQDATYWEGEQGSSPLIVETGGGGVHFYYAMPNDVEVRNRTRVLGRQIDIRAEGGYVTAPPSLHPNGNQYVWRPNEVKNGLPRFEPGWLTLEHHEQVISHISPAVQVRKVVAYIRRIHATAGEGGHNATFRAACKLRDAEFSQEEALAVLSDWNETNATPAWSAAELVHKINSAYHQKS